MLQAESMFGLYGYIAVTKSLENIFGHFSNTSSKVEKKCKFASFKVIRENSVNVSFVL